MQSYMRFDNAKFPSNKKTGRIANTEISVEVGTEGVKNKPKSTPVHSMVKLDFENTHDIKYELVNRGGKVSSLKIMTYTPEALCSVREAFNIGAEMIHDAAEENPLPVAQETAPAENKASAKKETTSPIGKYIMNRVCPKCGRPLIIRKGKNSGYFPSCTGFISKRIFYCDWAGKPEPTDIYSDEHSIPAQAQNYAKYKNMICKNRSCPECGGKMALRYTKNGQPYLSCTRMRNGKFVCDGGMCLVGGETFADR